EVKTILDKHVGGVIVAFNLVGEYEWEYADSDTTYTYALFEADLGAAYELSNAVSLGLELNAPFKFYGTAPPGAEDNGVLNAGPAFRARFDGWWVATSVLAQVVALKHATSDHLNLEEHERFQIRTIWGFHL